MKNKNNNKPNQFKFGCVYNSDLGRYVFLGRFNDKNGVNRGWFYPAADAKHGMKEDGYVFADFCDECEIRIFNGIERATFCEDAEDICDYDLKSDRPIREMKVDFFPPLDDAKLQKPSPHWLYEQMCKEEREKIKPNPPHTPTTPKDKKDIHLAIHMEDIHPLAETPSNSNRQVIQTNQRQKRKPEIKVKAKKSGGIFAFFRDLFSYRPKYSSLRRVTQS